MPEDSRDEVPPSYAAAQADAVPPYWDTTVHAPFAPDSFGDMIIDSLPTGSLFSFLWNMLVSISFQFVGFLLTYLLHTTHAARFGSRAGLGVTLIQYGFALRSRMDSADGEPASWGSWKLHPPPSGSTRSDSYDPIYNTTLPSLGNVGAGSSASTDQTGSMLADATTEWLSFFLMTIGKLTLLCWQKTNFNLYTLGWFILLTSILGFWRVKRWERGILASQRSAPSTAIDAQRDAAVVSQLHPAFTLRGVAWPGLFRQGFGLRGATENNEPTRTPSRAEEGLVSHDDARETDSMLPHSTAGGPQSNDRIMAELVTRDRRLRADLHAAGFM